MPADAITLLYSSAYGFSSTTLEGASFTGYSPGRLLVVSLLLVPDEWAVLQQGKYLPEHWHCCSSTEFTLGSFGSCGGNAECRLVAYRFSWARSLSSRVRMGAPLSYQITIAAEVRTRRLTFELNCWSVLKAYLAAQAGTALTFFVHPRFKHDLL